MQMSANIGVRADVCANKPRPLAEHFLLNVKRRRQAVGERIVHHNKPRFDRRRGKIRFGDFLFQKRRLLQAKIVTGNRVPVFRMAVVLILAAVKHHPPNVAETESIVGFAVFGGGIGGKLLGKVAAHIVVAAGENNRNVSAGQRRGNSVNVVEFRRIAAVVDDIAVQNQKIRIAECLRRRNRRFHAVVRVGNVIGAHPAVRHGGESKRNFRHGRRFCEIRLAFNKRSHAHGIAACGIQRRHRHRHAVQGRL